MFVVLAKRPSFMNYAHIISLLRIHVSSINWKRMIDYDPHYCKHNYNYIISYLKRFRAFFRFEYSTKTNRSFTTTIYIFIRALIERCGQHKKMSLMGSRSAELQKRNQAEQKLCLIFFLTKSRSHSSATKRSSGK